MHKRATLMMGNGWRVPRVRKLQPVGRHKKTLRGSQIKLADELALKPVPQPQTFYANEAWNVKDTQKQGVKISVDQKQSSPFQEEQKEKKKTGMMWINRPEQHRPLSLGSGDRSGSPMQGWGQSCGAADWRCGPLRSRGWAWMTLGWFLSLTWSHREKLTAKEAPSPLSFIWERKEQSLLSWNRLDSHLEASRLSPAGLMLTARPRYSVGHKQSPETSTQTRSLGDH